MAKMQSDSVYRVVDVVGVSDKSWEDAGRRAVETAAGSLRDLRVAEVTKMDMRVKDGKVIAFRTPVALSFIRGLIRHIGCTRIGQTDSASECPACVIFRPIGTRIYSIMPVGQRRKSWDVVG